MANGGPYPTPYIPVEQIDLGQHLARGMQLGIAETTREEELDRRRNEFTEGQRQFNAQLAFQREQYEKMKEIAMQTKELERLQYEEAIKAREDARVARDRSDPLVTSKDYASFWAGKDKIFSGLDTAFRSHEEKPGFIRKSVADTVMDNILKLKRDQRERYAFTEAARKQQQMDLLGATDAAISQEADALYDTLDRLSVPYTALDDAQKIERPGFLGMAADFLTTRPGPIRGTERFSRWVAGQPSPEEEALTLTGTKLRQQQKLNREVITSQASRLKKIADLIETQRNVGGGFSESSFALLRDLPGMLVERSKYSGANNDDLISQINRLKRLRQAAGLKVDLKAEADLTKVYMGLIDDEFKAQAAILKSDASESDKQKARERMEEIKRGLR